MPPVDLETLVCGGGGAGDGKVSCETLIATAADPDPNLPPESVAIPIHQFSLDLAVAYERDDSTKESTNPKSQAHNPNPNPTQSRSNSQRYASAVAGANLKANGPIIGLPHKIKHVACASSSRSRTDTSSRIFPKKRLAAAGGNRKSAVPDYEPSSPKVSCIGKVLSDRERERCRLARRRPSPEFGCWAGLAALFSCAGGGRGKAAIEAAGERSRDDVARGNIPLRKRNIPSVDDEMESAAAPGLGGMKRFASGRRAASWGDDVEGPGGGHLAMDISGRSMDEEGSRDVGPIAV